MKRILICIILIVSVLMLSTCNSTNIDPNATKIYEYSYITGKDGIIKNSNKDNKVYISLGKPAEAAGQDFGLSFVKEYNGQIYTVNKTANLYKVDSQCKVCKKFSENDKPFLFDIDNGNIFYETSEYFSIYKSSIDGMDGGNVIGYDILANKLSYEDSWDSLSNVDFRNTFIAVDSHIFYKAKDEKLHRMTENGNEDTLLTPTDEMFNLKYFNGWIYFIDYNFVLKRIKPYGGNTQTVASGIFIKDYEIDEESNDIVLQTDKDEFYLLKPDLKMSKIDYSIRDFITEYKSANLSGFEHNKVYLYIEGNLSTDIDDIISFDIKDNGNQLDLNNNVCSSTYYWPRLLDSYIYYYNKNTGKYCRINVNTLNVEEIGEPFQYEMPANNVPNVTY